MADAYMKWKANNPHAGMGGPPSPAEDMLQMEYKVDVIDLLVGQGLIPCSPFKPTLVVAARVLEMYRLAKLRCPQLGVQSWMKALSDMHGVPFKPYSAQQFTTCFDVYLDILSTVEGRVKAALGRDGEDWRLKNCCPACTYKLEGEAKLIFDMLAAMDGNDSLKRIWRLDGGVNESGAGTRGASERQDPRAKTAGGDYFLDRERVDRWAKDRWKEWAASVNPLESPEPQDGSECKERWKNLSEKVTAKMWGIFDETGVFLALCRHGFVLLVADMVRSGELGKYGLAIAQDLLAAFGGDIGLGYDIGCGFGTTIQTSPLGPKAKALNLRMLVGSFHGHAHNRKCQLRFLARYMKGLGLEDLEGCERMFSQSNGLSRSVRYASVFHRKQTIRTYFAHRDTFETYANLSTFLVNNYNQALEMLDTQSSLDYAMDQAGVTAKIFESRIAEEKAYLDSLSKEPEEETDQMDYYQQLVNLADRKIGTYNCRHARENYDRALVKVQEIEARLLIETRWTPDDKEWKDSAKLVVTRRYRRCVDTLEELVLQRLMELTTANDSGKAYKLRAHIAKALQVRSKAIRNALGRYNTAARALVPPRRTLTWEEVVDYTFLSDFDILRDPMANAEIRSWAIPAARELMDHYFKLERAKEEIQRLDIEIRRVITYIGDEKEFLVRREAEIMEEDPVLAYFVGKYRMERGRFDDIHMQRFQALKKKLGPKFTGSLEPGTRRAKINVTRTKEGARSVQEEMEVPVGESEEDQWVDNDEGEGETAEGEELSEALEGISLLAIDKDGNDE
ncbi:hypothetical protein C8R47DRAFT_1180494 [Mycena vitilis]|nr:hypothetical protein C8R47DRAFT_1180494 [Mycena vitilis]